MASEVECKPVSEIAATRTPHMHTEEVVIQVIRPERVGWHDATP